MNVPLSFAQQQMWLDEQLEPGTKRRNTPVVLRYDGVLDITALERSLNEIQRRHEILRTTFTIVDGEPSQLIHPFTNVTLAVERLNGLPEFERDGAAQEIIAQESSKPFDLQHGPLLRSKLLCISADDYRLLLVMHHIVIDPWSLGILMRELDTLYSAFSKDQPSPLCELPIQYADYAMWQREWLQGEALESHLAYWRQQLQGELPVATFTADRPRPVEANYSGASHPLSLSRTLTEALKRLCCHEGLTSFMALLAAFKILLYRSTRQQDVVIATPTANRNSIEVEQLIGFFSNMVLLRTDFSGNPSYREVLSRVRRTTLAAYAHQALPFEELIEELHLGGKVRDGLLSRVSFSLLNAPPLTRHGPSFDPQHSYVDIGIAEVDLTLSLWESPGGVNGHILYRTELFDDVTIARIAADYESLLQDMVAHPDLHI